MNGIALRRRRQSGGRFRQLRRQANLLFCDGHVESGRQAGWVADSARRRWNNDHEPHPETWGRP